MVSMGAESGGLVEARTRTGDHTAHLLKRFRDLEWVGPVLGKIESWLRDLDVATGDERS